MHTTPFSTARQRAAACALALSITLGMLLAVDGLAAHGVNDAQLAAAAAAQWVAAPSRAASGV